MAAIVAVFTMALASAAQAHTPYTAQAWGENQHGQLGDGTTTGPETCPNGSHTPNEPCSTTPVAVSDLSGVTAVSGGGNHGLALLENGTVMAWGENSSGQLGNGTTTSSDVPVAVSGLKEVIAVSAGSDFSLALLKNGTVMAWGAGGFYGQLGNGTKESSDVPVEVSGLGEVTAIAAGSNHSLALLKNGTVMAWGSNENGALGDGTTTGSDVPVAVSGGLSSVIAISAGSSDSLALLSNGTVMAWGENKFGQLGNGTTTSSHVPVAVSGLSTVSAISAGQGYALALLSSGAVDAWGENATGQLGDGTSTGPEMCGEPPEAPFACSKTPLAVSGLSGVTAVDADRNHSLALLSNTTVKAWGGNEDGQLGIGTSTGPEPCNVFGDVCSTKPLEVVKMIDARGIAAGSGFSLAFGPPPAVTKVEPDAGKAGAETSVTITGTDFTGATAVKFGGVNATSFTVNSDTSITAVAPAEPASKVDVTVTTGWGTSATTPADQFTYVAPGPAPTVTKVKPKKGPLAGGTPVMIKGTNFTGVTAVKFGSKKATSFTVRSATSITAILPSGSKAKEKVAVTVTTPNGTSSSAITKKDRFKYVG